MDTSTTATLHDLLRAPAPPCVSIFIPAQRGAYDLRQARLDLKNLIAKARHDLAMHVRPAQTEALLAPAEALLHEGAPWPEGGGGIGVFLSAEHSFQVRLPLAVEPVVMVGERFHVLPLLAGLYPQTSFHVLAVSRNSLKLFRGTRHGLGEVHLADLPGSMDDALWSERHENVLISHGGPRMGGSAQPAAVLHGGQAWQDERKDMFQRYFQQIDGVLEHALFSEGAPLVLAAVEREVSGFRAVSHHPNICAASVLGNPDDLSLDVLHRRSWDIVRQHMDITHREPLLHRFDELAGTRRRSVDAGEILDAASVGRVEMVLVPEPIGNWSHAGPRMAGGVEAFVNNVVVEALTHGGDVMLVPPSRLPAGSAVGAIFRWRDAVPSTA